MHDMPWVPNVLFNVACSHEKGHPIASESVKKEGKFPFDNANFYNVIVIDKYTCAKPKIK
jgi:hypothetical protein